jgi:arylsulfatase A
LVLLTLSACKKADHLEPRFPDSTSNTKPNIILILGDDIGYEVPGFTGGQSYSTPNIDRMAEQGLNFTRCFGSPMCAPSRFMLLTGKYNYRNYGENSWGDLGLDQRTIANMLQSNGYATCAAGKWQFNHGDTGLKTFGFDKYCITDPFKVASEDNSATLRLYKNPTIFENGAYLPGDQMLGKYSEDIFLQYLFDFIDSTTTKTTKPFFAYYAPNLCHKPFSPTPDDPEFASWDPYKRGEDADTVFFKSMLSYFDKNIGKLIAKLQESNLQKNTLILFVMGDNGTEDIISSQVRNHYIKGGKGHTYITGIHVPFVAYWPGQILPGKNGNIVDFVDFLPTIAAAADVSLPVTYGPLDGISFYDQLYGDKKNVRKYDYNWYDVNRFGSDGEPAKVWAMDKDYKVYSNNTGLIDYQNDFLEKHPILDTDQTDDEKTERATLQSVIDSYHN